MKSPPFRKAVKTDPYFKRLSSTNRKNFWKIFANIDHSLEFKDLMEKTLAKFPSQRFSIDQIRGSKFFDDYTFSKEDFLEEIRKRHDIVEQAKAMQ